MDVVGHTAPIGEPVEIEVKYGDTWEITHLEDRDFWMYVWCGDSIAGLTSGKLWMFLGGQFHALWSKMPKHLNPEQATWTRRTMEQKFVPDGLVHWEGLTEGPIVLDPTKDMLDPFCGALQRLIAAEGVGVQRAWGVDIDSWKLSRGLSLFAARGYTVTKVEEGQR